MSLRLLIDEDTQAKELVHRIVLTRNCEHFKALHDSQIAHLGILAIYQDHDPAKRMSYAAIVRAVANVEATGLDLAGLFLALNAWDY